MNRNNLTRFFIVLIVLAWAFYEMYPPVGEDLGQYFQEQAKGPKDAAYTNIIETIATLQKANPRGGFRNVANAVGTADITRYFPQPEYKAPADSKDPSLWVLNQLQNESAGKIKLGIDLMGGSQFLVEMDTNSIANDTNGTPRERLESQALSQAVDVMTKRLNKFGVSEPVIQPQGNNRILIQLPGLSDAERVEAQKAISNIAYLEFKLVLSNSDELVGEQSGWSGYTLMPLPHKSVVDGRDL